MKIFDPFGPFLRSVVSAANGLGAPLIFSIRDEGREVINIDWFPTLPKGILAYDDREGRWDQDGEPVEDQNLILDIWDDGDIRIRNGDDFDGGFWLKTTLLCGDELAELIDFYQTADANQIGKSGLVEKPLAQLIEQVLLLIPRQKEAPVLMPLDGQAFCRQYPDAVDLIDAWLSGNWERIMELGGFSDIIGWLAGQGVEYEFNDNDQFKSGDLIITRTGAVQYSGMFMAEADSILGSEPAIVLRTRQEVSRMWLIDYFKYALESEGAAERICEQWKSLPRGLNNLRIKIPSAKRDQVAASIERRSARSTYLEELQSAMRMREPFNQIKTTYEKRTRAAKGLHTENLEDLISIQDPLPYFIEYPYRNFRREDDHVRRIGAAKRLVSVLAKAPLYLVIEELLHLGDPLGNEFLELLTGAAPSDGTLAGLHTRLFQRFGEAGNVKLGIFEELLQCIADNSLLMTMVEARNRYTHEPFDDHGFLQLMDNHAPRFVYALRGALKNCRFIVPINLRVEPDTNKKIVTAEDACNSDAYFRRVDLEVQQPLEKFPTGKLLAYRATPESTFVLNTLVRTEIVTEKIRDFQLFDRAKGEERVFSNVRRNLTT